MSEKERKAMDNKNGIEAITDDELDEATGGADYNHDSAGGPETAQLYAKIDGRLYMLPSGNLLCMCNHEYKYARRRIENPRGYTPKVLYKDIKCYKCKKKWDTKGMSK